MPQAAETVSVVTPSSHDAPNAVMNGKFVNGSHEWNAVSACIVERAVDDAA